MSTRVKSQRKPKSPKKTRPVSILAPVASIPSSSSMERPPPATHPHDGPALIGGGGDEMPGDIRAFFGHPLVTGEDNQASALALLHEYQNLPAIDHSDNKIRDKYDGFTDILSKNEQGRGSGSSVDQYSLLMNSDVDAFLNISGGQANTPAPPDASPAVVSPHSEESRHSSGGILDVSSSPTKSTDMRVSPEPYVELPDLPVNSPPVENAPSRNVSPVHASPSHNSNDSACAQLSRDTNMARKESESSAYDVVNHNEIYHNNSPDHKPHQSGPLSDKTLPVNSSTGREGSPYGYASSHQSAPRYEENRVDTTSVTHKAEHIGQQQNQDPFGLFGSHMGYPPVSSEQNRIAVSGMDNSHMNSVSNSANCGPLNYSTNLPLKQISEGKRTKKPKSSKDKLQPHKPDVFPSIMDSSDLDPTKHSFPSTAFETTRAEVSFPTCSQGSSQGDLSPTSDNKANNNDKYIQEFQDFVSRSEGVSQLETALRAPRRPTPRPVKMDSASEDTIPMDTSRTSMPSSENSLPPPPPYSHGSTLHGLNLPPISAICRQIQNDHPQLAGVPLSIIEKSLLTLGFPANRVIDSALGDRSQFALAQQQAILHMSGIRPMLPGMQPGPPRPLTPTSMPISQGLLMSSNTSVAPVQSAMTSQAPTQQTPDHVPMNLSQYSARGLDAVDSLAPLTTLAPHPTSQADTQRTIPESCNKPIEAIAARRHPPTPPTEPTSQGLSIAAHVLAQQALQRSMAALQAQQAQHMAALGAGLNPRNVHPQDIVSSAQQTVTSAPTEVTSVPVVTASAPLLSATQAGTTPSVTTTITSPMTSAPTGLASAAHGMTAIPFATPPVPLDANLLSSMVRTALFPQLNTSGGATPSHVILPKSLFNMATQGMNVPLANPPGALPLGKTPEAATTPQTETPITVKNPLDPTSSANFTTLAEYLRTHQTGMLQPMQNKPTPDTDMASEHKHNNLSSSPNQPDIQNTLRTPDVDETSEPPRRPSFLPVATAFNEGPPTPVRESIANLEQTLTQHRLHSTAPSSAKQVDTPQQMLEAAAMVTGRQAEHHQRNLLLAHAALVSGKNPEQIFNDPQSQPDTSSHFDLERSSESTQAFSSMHTDNTMASYSKTAMVTPSQSVGSTESPLHPDGRQSAPLIPYDVNPRVQMLQQRQESASAPTTPVVTPSKSQVPGFPTASTLDVHPGFGREATPPIMSGVHTQNFTHNLDMRPSFDRSMSNGTDFYPDPSIDSFGHRTPILPDSRIPSVYLDKLTSMSEQITMQNSDRAMNSVTPFTQALTVAVPQSVNPAINTPSASNKGKKKKTAKVSASSFAAEPFSMSFDNTGNFSNQEPPGFTRNLHAPETLNRNLLKVQEPARGIRDHRLGMEEDVSECFTSGNRDGPSFPPKNLDRLAGIAASAMQREAEALQKHSHKKRRHVEHIPFDSNYDRTVADFGNNSTIFHRNSFDSETHVATDLSLTPPYPSRRFALQPDLSRNHRDIAGTDNMNGAFNPEVNPVKPMDISSGLLGPKQHDIVVTPQRPLHGAHVMHGGAHLHGAPVTPPNAHAHYHDMKSPDSGIGESCVSPSDVGYGHQSDGGVAQSADRKRKRPLASRGVMAARPAPSFSLPERRPSITAPYQILKIDSAQCLYHCHLDTPISASQKLEDDRITYMNKGQFYNVIIEYKRKNRPLPNTTVKSVVSVVFRDDKSVADEFRAWQFWHSRQHSTKQRILDIDVKGSDGLLAGSVDEIAHNAITLKWDPLQKNAKVSITINCLSTDFSNQKGVKGLPLHVQVDTFEEENQRHPVHRAYCQVKVFCDKGAERKARDEERKKACKHPEAAVDKAIAVSQAKKGKADKRFHPPCDISEFYDMADLRKEPIFFTPVKETEEASPPPKAIVFPTIDPKMAQVAPTTSFTSVPGEVVEVVPKRPRQSVPPSQRPHEKVLLYVRERHESVFTALLLLQPSLTGLLTAIEEKYGIPVSQITNIYKRSKRGILVKMDDNIVRHYSNESTFLITLQRYGSPADAAAPSYDITLQDLD